MASEIEELREQVRQLERRIPLKGGAEGDVLVRRHGRPFGAAWEIAAEVLQAEATVDLTLTTSAQSFTGTGDSSKVRLLLDTGTWIVLGVFDFDCTVAGDIAMIGELFVDDSVTAETEQAVKRSYSTTDRATVSQHWKVTVTAADTPVELKARKSAALGTALARNPHTTLVAVRATTGSTPTAGAGGVTDHGALTGLADPDHSAYAALADVPGGELGGTYASPTVDTTHSGSAHHAEAHGIAAHTAHANWKVLYTDGSGDEQELALGADGTVLTSTGASTAPAFETPAAGSVSMAQVWALSGGNP